MASKPGRRGIGRGLSAILPESDAGDAGELRELPVELIKPNPDQPRTKFDPEALKTAMAYGILVASFNVEGFGLDRMRQITRDNIEARLAEYRKMLSF